MVDLSDEVPLDQALNYYEARLTGLPGFISSERLEIESAPPNDPEARLRKARLRVLDELLDAVTRRVDADFNSIWKRLGELNDHSPGTSSSRTPFSDEETDKTKDALEGTNFDEASRELVLDTFNEPKMGAPRKDRIEAIEAMRLHMEGKSYPEIADRLCGNPSHHHGKISRHNNYPRYEEKKLDQCSDRYRALVRGLKKILKKYPSNRPTPDLFPPQYPLSPPH